jgi:hypothetical protein
MGSTNLRVVEARDFIEDGNDVDGRDQHGEDRERDRDDRAPDPPGARQAADNSEQKHGQQAAQHQIHAEILELIGHPGAEGLGGESVFVLAEIVFVNRERERRGWW